MNQEKIGKFIVKCRKEKKMTQEELACKLGVTNKSISRWENGKTMPDISLMKLLCRELEISVNDLINGEKIDKDEYSFKVEENILNTIDYSDKKIKNNNRKFKIFLTFICLFLLVFVTLFIIDVRRMNQNKPVFFSTWGYDYTPTIKINESDIYLAINNYLVKMGDSEEKHHDGEKTFVSMRVYLLEEKERDLLYYVSSWVLGGTYYLENDMLKKDSGYSMPYKFKVEKVNGEFIVTDSRYPRDGNYYVEDMKNMFSKYVRNDMEEIHIDGTIDMLEMEVSEKAKLYFHK